MLLLTQGSALKRARINLDNCFSFSLMLKERVQGFAVMRFFKTKQFSVFNVLVNFGVLCEVF